jgi:hypothetical protein
LLAGAAKRLWIVSKRTDHPLRKESLECDGQADDERLSGLEDRNDVIYSVLEALEARHSFVDVCHEALACKPWRDRPSGAGTGRAH